MRELRYTGAVTGGHLPPDVRRAIAGALSRFEGKRVTVVVKEWKRKRSPRQNDFYWSVIVPQVVAMHRDAGDVIDAEDAHDFLQREVLKRVRTFRGLDGQLLTTRISSGLQSPAEWEENNEIIRAWAATHGYVIPRPNEHLEEFQY